jgi:hypothetical protein
MITYRLEEEKYNPTLLETVLVPLGILRFSKLLSASEQAFGFR